MVRGLDSEVNDSGGAGQSADVLNKQPASHPQKSQNPYLRFRKPIYI
jgi:hypothetical protein